MRMKSDHVIGIYIIKIHLMCFCINGCSTYQMPYSVFI